MNAHIRAVADQYASDGFVALAPDVFWRTQPRVELTYEGADRDKGIELMKRPTWASRSRTSARPPMRCARARSGRQGCRDRLLLRRPARVPRGRDRQDRRGRGLLRRRHQNALDLAGQIKQPILFHYAGHDHAIPPEAVDR